jgi:glucosamine--fructose-6-phosphate aminotransferase (isomerizing)
VCQRLDGAFTLVAVSADDPGRVVGRAAARRSSSAAATGENFLASDVAAFIAHTREALELGQDQVVDAHRHAVVVTDFAGRRWSQALPRRLGRLRREKGGYDYFMLKEIAEQPQAVADTLLGRFSPTAARAGRDAPVRRRAARGRQDHHRRGRARRSTPA